MENSIPYYPTSLLKKGAITLVAHGLNVRPTAMLSLVNWLNSLGSDVYVIQLSGHHNNGVNIEKVTPAIWKEEMLAGYEFSRKAASHNSVPLFFLGYSLGALLGQSMIALGKERTSFDKQILIAPATAIRQRSYIIRFLFFLGKKTRIKSFTPQEYRVNDSLPLHIYQILFSEERKVIKAQFNGLNMPTLILIDPKDELISYKKLLSFISRFKLTNYRVIVLQDDLKSRDGKYHHLVLNEQTMGKENWSLATKEMEKFLFSFSNFEVR